MYAQTCKNSNSNNNNNINNNNNNNNNNRIRLHLVKHLMIKMSEKSLTQRFDDSMSSLSSEKRIKNFTA